MAELVEGEIERSETYVYAIRERLHNMASQATVNNNAGDSLGRPRTKP